VTAVSVKIHIFSFPLWRIYLRTVHKRSNKMGNLSRKWAIRGMLLFGVQDVGGLYLRRAHELVTDAGGAQSDPVEPRDRTGLEGSIFRGVPHEQIDDTHFMVPTGRRWIEAKAWGETNPQGEVDLHVVETRFGGRKERSIFVSAARKELLHRFGKDDRPSSPEEDRRKTTQLYKLTTQMCRLTKNPLSPSYYASPTQLPNALKGPNCKKLAVRIWGDEAKGIANKFEWRERKADSGMTYLRDTFAVTTGRKWGCATWETPGGAASPALYICPVLDEDETRKRQHKKFAQAWNKSTPPS
jgi:hypothetical protein